MGVDRFWDGEWESVRMSKGEMRGLHCAKLLGGARTKATTEADPYGMTTRKTTATAKATAPAGPSTRAVRSLRMTRLWVGWRWSDREGWLRQGWLGSREGWLREEWLGGSEVGYVGGVEEG